MKEEGIYGLAAEFETHEQLLHAAEKAYSEGFREMDGYAPFPVDGLAQALGKKNRMPQLVLAGGVTGGIIAYAMQWYANVISYPINIGGRPLHSWPAFVPITFELTVLGASLTAFLFSLGLSGLPKPYHPMFNLPQFERASQDRFFLCIEARDPRFDTAATRGFLENLRPIGVLEVPR